ncbi:MAG: hypothetical protein HY231_20355 [Acidobacteria bacterium]|nr:hypothetical protein [Acidobacteriota bacterium]
MKSPSRHIHCAVALLAIGILLTTTVHAIGGQAATGTYTASLGNSAGMASGGATGSGGGAARGRMTRGGGSASTAASGANVSLNISSYSTQEEINKLVQTQNDASAFLNTLNGYNHGSVTISGKSYPINAAYSLQAGSNYYIYLVSAKPFSGEATGRGGRGGKASGAAGGYIRLTVNSGGSGDGALYTSTQVTVQTNGAIEVRGGASTASQLTNVAHQ